MSKRFGLSSEPAAPARLIAAAIALALVLCCTRASAQDTKKKVEQADDFIKQAKKTISLQNDLRKKQEKAILEIGRDVSKSASGLVEDRYPPRFFESAKRKEAQLTKAEKELLKALHSTVSIDFNKTPFKDVLEYLQDKTKDKLTILVDDASLKDASVEYDSPVTFKHKSLTVRTILRKILADRGLTYIVKDAHVHVLTTEKARSIMVQRIYPIGDLVAVLDMRWGPAANRAQMMRNVQQLINLIVTTIEPDSWKINNPDAHGTIVFHEQTMSLIIRNSAEFHRMVPGAIEW